MLTALLLLSLPFATPPSASAPTSLAAQKEKSTRDSFVELHAKKDEAGCAELWRAHPYEVLYAIDEDLEGALATWEKSPASPDTAAIGAQHERALWGARIATKVSGHPIFLDYTASYVGFDEASKKQFRDGQRLHGEARAAMKAKDFAKAAELAQKCSEAAFPLGDWWGYAMGLSARGQALVGANRALEAIAPLSQAAAVYHDLGLIGDEYGCQKALTQALIAAKRHGRALAAIERARAIAEVVQDKKGVPALLQQKLECEQALGDSAAAERTKAELDKAGKSG